MVVLRGLKFLLVGVAILALVALMAGWWLSAPGHQGPRTDHFDGVTFHNRVPTELPNARKATPMLFEGRGPWSWREIAPQPPPPSSVDDMRVTFINHTTVLVQTPEITVLTDPIWSERCSPSQWIGPARYHAPGVALEDLPPIDVVLISHNHYDHLDVNTLQALEKRDAPVVIAGLGNAAYLRSIGITEARELDWEASTTVEGVRITGTPTRHFSSRGLFDRQRTLWLGFVVETSVGKVYFAGDTGYGPHFAETGERHGPFRLALLPIGAFAPRWVMAPIHMDPAEAVAAHQDLGAGTSVGVHHGTFQLTLEGQDAPATELVAARDAAGLPPSAFWVLAPGEGAPVPTVPSP